MVRKRVDDHLSIVH